MIIENDVIADNSLNQLYQSGVVGIAYARFNGDIIDANPSFLKLFGYTAEDLAAGKLNWVKMTPAEFLPGTKAIDALKESRNSPILIKEYLHKDGHRVAVLITSTVIDHIQADVMNCIFDVTDQEALKAQLTLVAAKYRSIWNVGIIGIYTWHINGYITDANDAYTHILGYSRDELRSGLVKWTDLIEPGHTKHIEGIAGILKGKPVIPYETRHRHKDGGYRTIMIGYEMLPGSATEGLAVVIDVSEQKALQERLLKTNDRIRKITEHMVDVITIFDSSNRYVYASAAIVNYFGKPAQAFTGKNYWEMEVPENICRLYDQCIAQVFVEKENVTVTYALNGHTYLQSLLTPEFNQRHEVETVLMVSRDITLLKQQEQQKDGFISLVGHELKTPVTVSKSLIQLAQRCLKNGNTEEALKHITKAERNLNKQVDIINHLMEVSRADIGKIKLVYSTFSLIELIEDCVEAIATQHDEHLITVLCPPGLCLNADRNRMEQVVCNLLSNASRYSSNKSKIQINVYTEDSDICVSVIDEGVGIAPQKLPFIFDRFYRVNEDGNHSSGLGLGLYLSAQIIKLHRGKLWAESQPGKGSVFYVKVPQ